MSEHPVPEEESRQSQSPDPDQSRDHASTEGRAGPEDGVRGGDGPHGECPRGIDHADIAQAPVPQPGAQHECGGDGPTEKEKVRGRHCV